MKRETTGKTFEDVTTVGVRHDYYCWRRLICDGSPELLFTDNESNLERLFGKSNRSPYAKDGINDYTVNGMKEAVNPDHIGTRVSACYHFEIDSGGNAAIRLRLTDRPPVAAMLITEYERTFATRIAEAEEFYEKRTPVGLSKDGRRIQRQAFAGMLWNKQFYFYDVSTWLEGNPAQPKPPENRTGIVLAAEPDIPAGRIGGGARSSAGTRSFKPITTRRTTSPTTNISTRMTGAGSGRATRRDGPGSWRN